jgi:hypothetical protein
MSGELERRLQDAVSEALSLVEQSDLACSQHDQLLAAVGAAEALCERLKQLIPSS